MHALIFIDVLAAKSVQGDRLHEMTRAITWVLGPIKSIASSGHHFYFFVGPVLIGLLYTRLP